MWVNLGHYGSLSHANAAKTANQTSNETQLSTNNGRLRLIWSPDHSKLLPVVDGLVGGFDFESLAGMSASSVSSGESTTGGRPARGWSLSEDFPISVVLPIVVLRFVLLRDARPIGNLASQGAVGCESSC